MPDIKNADWYREQFARWMRALNNRVLAFDPGCICGGTNKGWTCTGHILVDPIDTASPVWPAFHRNQTIEPLAVKVPLCLVQCSGGICNRPLGHNGVIHSETLANGELYAEWRSVVREDEDDRATEYKTPADRDDPR